MQAFLLILSLAVIVEALVQYAKTVIKMLENKQYKTFGTQLAAIFIAVFISSLAGHAAHGDRHFPWFQLCK